MGKVIYCIVVACICYLAARISRWITGKIFSAKNKVVIKNAAKAATLRSITESILKIGIYFIGILTILYELGVSQTSLAAVSGSIAVAIGLGAQGIVSDLIAGLFIIVEEQFHVGDIVTINNCTGTVENVSIRTTKLRGIDGTVYIVPNGTISTVTNKCKDYMNALVDVGVAYEEDLDNVIAVLDDEMEIAFEEVNGLQEKPDVLGVNSLDDSAVTIRVVAKCDVKENFKVERELRLRIKKRFDREGINIPYPQRTVRIVENVGRD